MKYPAYPTYKPSGVPWLGDVPEHWDVERARFCIHVNPRSNRLRHLALEDEIQFVPMEAVGQYGGLDLGRAITVEDASSGYTEFEDGDVVAAKITPCFENGKGALAGNLLNQVALGTTELHVLRPQPHIDNRFLFYLTISRPFRSAGEGEMYGAGGQKRVPADYCRNFRLARPPCKEQQAIADFLDAQTAKIDTLIAKKRELIDKLKEKRTALISRTVTRGLPPEAARAAGLDPHTRLRPSGVEWIGEIPEHWSVLPFTKYLADRSDYRGRTPEKVPEGIFLVTARNVRTGFIDYCSSQEYVAEDEYDEIMRRGLPKCGDILFTSEAPLGNVALVDREDVALAQRIIRFRPLPIRLDSCFVLYAMMSKYFQRHLQSLSTGSTAEGLKASKLPMLRIVAAPLPEQQAMASFLNRETTKIDQMTGKVEAAIERLREYRSALITAAVTGKIDVREIAA